jgi:hypothetical protein
MRDREAVNYVASEFENGFWEPGVNDTVNKMDLSTGEKRKFLLRGQARTLAAVRTSRLGELGDRERMPEFLGYGSDVSLPDAVNKLSLEVRHRNCGSPEIKFSNFFSSDFESILGGWIRTQDGHLLAQAAVPIASAHFHSNSGGRARTRMAYRH